MGKRERTVSVRMTLSGARSADMFLSLGEGDMVSSIIACAYRNIIIDSFKHTYCSSVYSHNSQIVLAENIARWQGLSAFSSPQSDHFVSSK